MPYFWAEGTQPFEHLLGADLTPDLVDNKRCKALCFLSLMVLNLPLHHDSERGKT